MWLRESKQWLASSIELVLICLRRWDVHKHDKETFSLESFYPIVCNMQFFFKEVQDFPKMLSLLNISSWTRKEGFAWLGTFHVRGIRAQLPIREWTITFYLLAFPFTLASVSLAPRTSLLLLILEENRCPALTRVVSHTANTVISPIFKVKRLQLILVFFS